MDEPQPSFQKRSDARGGSFLPCSRTHPQKPLRRDSFQREGRVKVALGPGGGPGEGQAGLGLVFIWETRKACKTPEAGSEKSHKTSRLERY